MANDQSQQNETTLTKDIKKSRNWKWIYILSTPKWVITWYEARTLNVGGELICEIF